MQMKLGYFAKDVQTAVGDFKAVKDRTALLCKNASGAKMLKPLIINMQSRAQKAYI